MNTKDRLNLSNLIKEYQSEETTDKIRSLKHSSSIKQDVIAIQRLKLRCANLRKNDFSKFKELASQKAHFLYSNYANIFNKLMKDELDLTILGQFLIVLKQIEDGELDQHDGSYKVGMLLKKLYIDSALKQANNYDNNNTKSTPSTKTGKNINWNEYKKMQQ
jgi:hypothetical protein